MLSSTRIKSYAVISLFSILALAAGYQSLAYAEQGQDPSQVKVNVKSVEDKLALADKEAEPIYQTMDSLQASIASKKAQNLTPDENSLNQELQKLNEDNSALLSSFRQEMPDKTWSNLEEVKSLVAASHLSANDKKALTTYFEQSINIQNKLDVLYSAFDQSVASEDAQLVSLTAQVDRIYEKFGITKDVLSAYYATTGMPAD
ncbi:hypothetical protein A9Q68_08970 [Streptococcus bovimastitidis]|uniref:Chromosome assembly protein n=1 Tax=Streptococcus bovimastitidis TaxID=1856638 RepID=A0A1L8MKM4_9STRE|nr:hypothetical protein [Streptococcus bovimastitidis]OJF71317.1 hypothetical protein A9Q68_08970 [Streptococcus bovimastitidis]